ncbi:hypothetical protein PsorP6_002929 [Peronosclerospora sorghi]|uniref:Uncharacterized protein n=1 Tax=Peronosclerospora sorghi TaxID=230839 RepID=A0ACC0VMT2_9STRA|nr:hypothetical protein PsorP6_002929 [Peronosclerospora sorghi]
MCLYSLFCISMALLSSGSHGLNTSMATTNYSPQVPSVVVNQNVKRLLGADETTDNEDRIIGNLEYGLGRALRVLVEEIVGMGNLLAVAEKPTLPQGGSTGTALSRIRGATSSTAEAGDHQRRNRAAEYLIRGAKLLRLFPRQWAMITLFRVLCKIFGHKAMPKALYDLQEESYLSPPILSKLWESQFKYWKKKSVSEVEAYQQLPKFTQSDEKDHFNSKALVLDEYIKFRDAGDSKDHLLALKLRNDLLFPTLRNEYQADFAEMMNAEESKIFKERYFGYLKERKTLPEALFEDLKDTAGGVELFEGNNYKLVRDYMVYFYPKDAITHMVPMLVKYLFNDSEEAFAFHLARIIASTNQSDDVKTKAENCLIEVFQMWDRTGRTYAYDRSDEVERILENVLEQHRSGISGTDF